MTHLIERHALAPSARAGNLTHDAEALPILETTDGCIAGQQFNNVVEALTAGAEQSGLSPDDDGLYLIGNLQGGHLFVGSEVADTKEGTAKVNTLLVTDPKKSARFYLVSSERTVGHDNVVDLKVDEEIQGHAQSADFSGIHGDKLSFDAAEILKQLAVSVVDVASIQNEQREISNATLAEVVASLTAPETSRADHRKGFSIGSKVVSRLFSRVA